MEYADASPDKRFFIDLITRDISLEDAILDLIDNSIDSLTKYRDIDVISNFLDDADGNNKEIAKIKISFTPTRFEISDTCGGISFDNARDSIFRLGNISTTSKRSLGIFGIGMKRALFKIGQKINIKSVTDGSGFKMIFNVPDWLKETDPKWKLPIERYTNGDESFGTKIIIKDLRSEIITTLKNPHFQNNLLKNIKRTYPFHLNKLIDIHVNGIKVLGEDLSFGKSENIEPAMEKWIDKNVEFNLICGLLPKSDTEKWRYENSGWYLICNGRVVVYADKSELTGWGVTLPQFMPKNRGFIGLLFYTSDNPEDLPWKTTKRGVNTESEVFLSSRKRIDSVSRTIIRYQNKLYESNDDPEPRKEYRESLSNLQKTSATYESAKLTNLEEPRYELKFNFIKSEEQPALSTISYKVNQEQLLKVKKQLGRTQMSNKEVGEKTFSYFYDRECS